GLLVRVPPCDEEVGGEVGDAEHGEQPEEVIQVAAVDVVRDPPEPPAARRGARHDDDDRRARVVAERERRAGQAGAEAAHGVGRLVVEELHLPDEREHLRRPHHHVLRHLPEYRQRQVPPVAVVAVQAVPRDHAPPRHLQRAGDEHGDGEDDEADAHPRQLREPAIVAGHAARQGHDGAVVERHPEHDAEGVEDGEHGGGDLEAADARVQRVALEDEGGGHLRVRRREDDAARPHRQQPEHALELLHLRHRAQPPRARLCLVAGGLHGRLVQEPELVGVHEPAAPLYRGHAIDGVAALVQQRRVGRHLDVVLPGGGDHHLRDPGERAAPRRLATPVRGGAGEEHGDGQRTEDRRDAVPDPPPDAGLHPHQHGAADERAEVEREVEPVEEGALPAALALVGLVELAGAERRHDHQEPAAERHQVQPRVERRRAAVQQRRRRGARREHAVAQDGDGHEEQDGPVPAEERVGEVGGDERRDGAGALPVGDVVRRRLAALVQPVLEVVHQVRRHPEVG
ncbi:Os01g0902750, partial [Oryza sativa Japonica Group]